jgi:hypothetical protein
MDLAYLKHELETQNNRSTADPLFCVFEEERIPTAADYSDEFTYVD